MRAARSLSRSLVRASPSSATSASRAFGSASLQDLKDKRPSYLDNQATTPVDPRVLDAMLPFLTGRYGNPHSSSHAYGWDTETPIEKAREQIASVIGAKKAKEVIFTSGATESNNLAIKGACAYAAKKGKKHIITTETEHKCVLASCRELSVAEGIISLDCPSNS